ncbi:hypothetical protein [Brevundimonas denitrificans]|uniref:hypothetical protein n=1 Tax=Brevundimonas denitrificans TaxID=1443434 RepID=UPI00223BB8B5|nr:hypothetical protein [Brevundimonas denitrificans]
MSDFRRPLGFEDALRPPVDVRRARITRPVLRPPGRAGDAAAYGQLARIIRRAPEVMVKVTGKTRDGGHLKRHLDYISRNGELTLEGSDGARFEGRAAVQALASDWAAEAAMSPGRRGDSPLSRSIVLSMPKGPIPCGFTTPRGPSRPRPSASASPMCSPCMTRAGIPTST